MLKGGSLGLRGSITEEDIADDFLSFEDEELRRDAVLAAALVLLSEHSAATRAHSQWLLLVDDVQYLADPLFKLQKLFSLSFRLSWLTLYDLAIVELGIVEDITNFRAIHLLVGLRSSIARLQRVLHEDQILCDRKLLLFDLLLVFVVVIVGDDEDGDGVARPTLIIRHRHGRNMNARPHELTRFHLAVVARDHLVQLAVAHREAHQLFLHLLGHELVQDVLLGGRLLSPRLARLIILLRLVLLLGRCIIAPAKNGFLDVVHFGCYFKSEN